MAEAVRADAEVLAVRDEGGPNRRLVLRVPDWPGSEPGQFAMLSPGPCASVPRTDPLLPRPMAIYREAARNGAAEVEILFKCHGRGTALLAESRPGQTVRIVGPLGQGFLAPASGERAVIVAGGTGIASVYGLAAQLAGRPGAGPPEVLLGARAADDVMGEPDFAALGVPLELATEDGSRGRRGLVTDLLETSLGRGGPCRVYACGPTPMMRRAAEIAAQHGAACVTSLENGMACGFGACLGCAVPLAAGGFALVCREGPVFDAEAVAWDGMP